MPPLKKLQDSLYRNWVRAALGLFYLQEGLRDFVDDVVKSQHSKLVKNVQTTAGNSAVQCSHCLVDTILPAHSGKTCTQKKVGQCNCRRKKNKHCQFCSNMYDEIILNHRYSDPNWTTDASKWFTDHWQVAKCFLTTTSQSANNTAIETDAAGLLSIIINATFFKGEINSTINAPYDDFSQARLTRNEILHSSSLQLTDAEVARYLQIMIIALEDKKRLLNNPAAKKAVETLKQIQSDTLAITTETESKAIEMALKAIESKKEECIQEIERKEKESLQNIQEETDNASETKKKDCLDEMERKEQETLIAVKKEKETVTDLKTEIEDKAKESLLEIKKGTDTVTELKTEIEDKGKETLATIKKEKDSVVDLVAEVEKKGKEALHAIKTETDSVTETKRIDVIKELEKKEKEFILAIQVEKGKAMAEKKTELVEEIEKTGKEYLQMIKAEKDEAIMNLTLKAATAECVEKLKENICELDGNLQDVEKRLTSTESAIDSVNRDFRIQMEDLKGRVSTLETLQQQHEEQLAYIQKKQGLKTHLIEQYAEYIKADVSPFFPEEDVQLGKVFVPVKMSRKKQSGAAEKDKDKEEFINSLSDMFRNSSQDNCNVLVYGEAGMGKTTFCKALISRWCDAHSEVKNESQNLSTIFQSDDGKIPNSDDLEGMKKFDYLFYVSLRHAQSETFIEEMICNQLFFPEQKALLFDVLTSGSENCLIILDGLDEWNPLKSTFHPIVTTGFPKSRFQYTKITTTRPCGINLHQLDLKDFDMQVNLEGLGTASVNSLTKTTILELNKQLQTRVFFWKFQDEISKLKLEELCRTPIVLKLLVCLWFDEQSLGKSLCAIYSAIIDLMVKHANKRFKNDQSYQLAKASLTKSDNSLPSGFAEKGNCQDMKSLLITVSKLAFHALFSEDQSSSLVFKEDDIRQHGLSENEFYLCQKIGLIAVSKIPGRSAVNRYQKFSFPHKSIQEFLAAIYMTIILTSKGPLDENIRQAFSTMQGVLQFSLVLKFISGLSPEKTAPVFEYIGHVNVKETQESKIKLYFPARTKFAIQDMIFQCIEEGLACGHKNIQLKISELDIDLNTKIRLRPDNLDCSSLNKLKVHDERSAVENGFLDKLLSRDDLHMSSVVLENVSLTCLQLNMLFTKTLSLTLDDVDLSELDDCNVNSSGVIKGFSYVTKDFVVKKATTSCRAMTQLIGQVLSLPTIERLKLQGFEYSSNHGMWQKAKCKTLTTVQINPCIRVLELRNIKLPNDCMNCFAVLLMHSEQLKHVVLHELEYDDSCKCTLPLKLDSNVPDPTCQVLKHMFIINIPTQKGPLFDACLRLFLTADVIHLKKLSFTKSQMDEVLLLVADSAKIRKVYFKNLDCTLPDTEDKCKDDFFIVVPNKPLQALKVLNIDNVHLTHDQIDMIMSMFTNAMRCYLCEYKIKDVHCEGNDEDKVKCLVNKMDDTVRLGFLCTNKAQLQESMDTEMYLMFNFCKCWR